MEIYTQWIKTEEKNGKVLTLVLIYKYILCCKNIFTFLGFKCQNNNKEGKLDAQFTSNCNTIIPTANSSNFHFAMDC